MTGAQSRVWMITGAGRGLGRAFAAAALDAGDRVVATVRTSGSLDDLVETYPDDLAVLQLDVRRRDDVVDVVGRAIATFGRLDVVVNNAGHGLVGAIEEVSEDEARAIIDTDFFGPLWVVQAVLPHMRERGSGHIVQISSTAAVGTLPTFGMYNSAKWALEAFSEALAAEVRGFGIAVTIAEPSGFATDWAGSSMQFARPIAAYDDVRTSIFGTPVVPWDLTAPTDDAAPGDPDPEVAAAALIAHVRSGSDGPLRLLVGDDAPDQVAAALAVRRADYERDPRFTWP